MTTRTKFHTFDKHQTVIVLDAFGIRSIAWRVPSKSLSTPTMPKVPPDDWPHWQAFAEWRNACLQGWRYKTTKLMDGAK
jgi:hypothetical protein